MQSMQSGRQMPLAIFPIFYPFQCGTSTRGGRYGLSVDARSHKFECIVGGRTHALPLGPCVGKKDRRTQIRRCTFTHRR